ncbi:hypothetical protein NGR_c07740 [Sinorhizobium fredii NGR234]|uniref:Transposase n=1 Tax=Sinorhizobium fredii (strain NBRC 101917 / NGR234) TaxID=394 RepID=C3M8M1_SINFN|nr:hypothetical protein NGR_c07740 [Sinorhizobium fredii NGR234]
MNVSRDDAPHPDTPAPRIHRGLQCLHAPTKISDPLRSLGHTVRAAVRRLATVARPHPLADWRFGRIAWSTFLRNRFRIVARRMRTLERRIQSFPQAIEDDAFSAPFPALHA